MVALKDSLEDPWPADEPEAIERGCDHPDCMAAGTYRAPKSRHRLNDYYWFCLDHVRAYNKAWNYYEGLSDDEVEQSVRADTIWQRRTKPLGSWRAREHWLREKVAQDFYADQQSTANDHAGANRKPVSKGSEIDQAMQVLELAYPLDLATAKSQYKVLVKRHHPDANGGDKAAEEKLKAINHAYGVLKAALSV